MECWDPPEIFGRAEPAERSEYNNNNDRPVTGGEVHMKTFKNILEEVATEDDDDTAGPKEGDADAYRSHMTDPGAASLLGNDHVRMATLVEE